MNVLLVWENNPDSVDFYVIENPNEEQMRVLESSNGKFINSDDEVEDTMLISEAICTTKYIEYCRNKDWACIWENFRVEMPYTGRIDKVFHCGCMM